MNEQEASKKTQEMIAHRNHVFCPLIKETCRADCECYKMPEVHRNSNLSERELLTDDGFYVSHGFCTCYALKGACE